MQEGEQEILRPEHFKRLELKLLEDIDGRMSFRLLPLLFLMYKFSVVCLESLVLSLVPMLEYKIKLSLFLYFQYLKKQNLRFRLFQKSLLALFRKIPDHQVSRSIIWSLEPTINNCSVLMREIDGVTGVADASSLVTGRMSAQTPTFHLTATTVDTS